MNIDNYLHVYKEETLVKMGKDKYIAISRSNTDMDGNGVFVGNTLFTAAHVVARS